MPHARHQNSHLAGTWLPFPNLSIELGISGDMAVPRKAKGKNIAACKSSSVLSWEDQSDGGSNLDMLSCEYAFGTGSCSLLMPTEVS